MESCNSGELEFGDRTNDPIRKNAERGEYSYYNVKTSKKRIVVLPSSEIGHQLFPLLRLHKPQHGGYRQSNLGSFNVGLTRRKILPLNSPLPQD